MMEKQNLLEHAKELQAVLERAKDLDAEKSDLMGNLLSEVVVHATSTEEGAVASRKYSEVLRDQVSHFESDHPKIASMIDSLATMLANLGI